MKWEEEDKAKYFSQVITVIMTGEGIGHSVLSYQTVVLLVSGKKLSDLERVTSLKVYNWFANRRKEIKRRANIGNVHRERPLSL